jgi:hypothetical protein
VTQISIWLGRKSNLADLGCRGTRLLLPMSRRTVWQFLSEFRLDFPCPSVTHPHLPIKRIECGASNPGSRVAPLLISGPTHFRGTDNPEIPSQLGQRLRCTAELKMVYSLASGAPMRTRSGKDTVLKRIPSPLGLVGPLQGRRSLGGRVCLNAAASGYIDSRSAVAPPKRGRPELCARILCSRQPLCALPTRTRPNLFSGD